MQRVLILRAAAVLLLAATFLGPIAPAQTTPKSAELRVGDPVGDVGLQPGVPVPPVGPIPDAIDLTEVRLYGETGELIRALLRVKDLRAEANYPTLLSSGIDYGICFKVGETTYAVRLNLIYAGEITIIPPKIGVATACGPTGVTFGKTMTAVTVFADPLESTIHFVVPRRTLGQLTGGAPPVAGVPVTSLFAFARDQRPQALRYDSAGPSQETIALAHPTANGDLRMSPDANVAPQSCGVYRDLPTYAIESGGKRGIPVTVSNLAGGERRVRLTVGTLDGPDWKARMMPTVAVPAGTADGAGNTTVNVIVDTPSGTRHRECSTLLVRAIDESDPTLVGESSLNVVAAIPPSRERTTLHLHSDDLADDACSYDHIWMNIDSADPLDDGKQVLLRGCEDLNPTSATDATVIFPIDVNPSRDLVLNTSAVGRNADVSLLLRADGPPTRAKVTTTLLAAGRAGTEYLGDRSEVVTFVSAFTPVAFQIPIAFTRETVGTGDPSRLVDATSRLALSVRYEPLPLDSNVDQVRPSGLVYLMPKGSSIDLPIWDSIKRNVVDPGVSGALIGLKAGSPTELYANPGKQRVFDFTVLNEGATTDVAVVEVRPLGKAWTAQVAPSGPFPLAPGEKASFQVGITPPSDAAESDVARFEVVAMSQSDPSARSAASLTLTSTAGQELEGDTLEDVVPDAAKGGLPMGSWASLVVATLGGLLLVRRRQ